jgi:hypothetical protein
MWDKIKCMFSINGKISIDNYRKKLIEKNMNERVEMYDKTTKIWNEAVKKMEEK